MRPFKGIAQALCVAIANVFWPIRDGQLLTFFHGYLRHVQEVRPLTHRDQHRLAIRLAVRIHKPRPVTMRRRVDADLVLLAPPDSVMEFEQLPTPVFLELRRRERNHCPEVPRQNHFLLHSAAARAHKYAVAHVPLAKPEALSLESGAVRLKGNSTLLAALAHVVSKWLATFGTLTSSGVEPRPGLVEDLGPDGLVARGLFIEGDAVGGGHGGELLSLGPLAGASAGERETLGGRVRGPPLGGPLLLLDRAGGEGRG